jgi:chorismate mutase
MPVRGIRGATTVDQDQDQQVLEATRELLQIMIEENQVLPEDIASVLFTTTADIKSVFPARAARDLGWTQVPLMCFQEIEIRESLPLCIRVLIHINTSKKQNEIKHIYLRQARQLRPDIAQASHRNSASIISIFFSPG